MSIKDQFTPEQWKILINAPGLASSYVSTASGGGFEVFSEVFTASKFAVELARKPGGSGYGELVDELLETMTDINLSDAKEYQVNYQSKDPAGIRAEIKQYIANAVSIVGNRSDAIGYKRFITDTARKVAETKTGGFMGIGSKSVIDEKEQAAIEELAALMGV
jgi:hypothetical protein